MRLCHVVGAVLLACLSLQGCSTVATNKASTYKEALTQFDKAMEAAQTALQTQTQALQETASRRNIEHTFYVSSHIKFSQQNTTTHLYEVTPGFKKILQDFSKVVCASPEALRLQRVRLAQLKTYNKTLQGINVKPKEGDLGEIFDSIRNNWKAAPALAPMDLTIEDGSTDKCKTEVENLILLPPTVVTQSPAAAGEIVSLVGAVIEALKKVAIAVLEGTDDFVRGAKLKKYVLDSEKEVDAALVDLNKPDAMAGEICETIGYGLPCRQTKEGKPDTMTAWDTVTIERKWAALREPWHLYILMEQMRQKMETAINAKPKDAQPKRESQGESSSTPTSPSSLEIAQYWVALDERQAELQETLKAYREIRTSPGAGDVARGIKIAHEKLYDLANGKITPGMAWGVFADMAKTFEKVADGSKTANQKVTDLLGEIRKLKGEGE